MDPHHQPLLQNAPNQADLSSAAQQAAASQSSSAASSHFLHAVSSMVDSRLAARRTRAVSSISNFAASSEQLPAPLIRQFPAITRLHLRRAMRRMGVFKPQQKNRYWGLLEAQYYSRQCFSYVTSFFRTWPVWNAFALSTWGQP